MPRILLSFPPFLPASPRRGFLADLADWATAFVNVAFVLLHLLAACIMSLLLWTVDRTIWVQLSIRDEPEEQQP